MSILNVSHVGKAYKRYPSKWSRIREWFSRKEQHQKTWVLKDIDFSIEPGEAIGIIGINGAGKSTLLKIITGTTQATTGTVQTTGRVAALLELGMGFHPNFTGRQNAFMAGQLLGLSHEEVQKCMPSIEAFAEIGDYIDRPVRLYSSGMQVRLAFSVATAVRPDLLIVDEALSVGDAYFQHKSFERIRYFKELGTSLLIVSHDKMAIQNLCDRAILLEEGSISKDGTPESVMDFYNARIADRHNNTISVKKTADGRLQTNSGSGEARVESINLVDESGSAIELVHVGQPVCLEITVHLNIDLPDFVLGYMIKDRVGQPIFGTNTHHLSINLGPAKAGDDIKLKFNFPMNIGPGSYSIATALHQLDTHLTSNYEWRDLALVFRVINVNQNTFVGSSWIPPTVEKIK